jgi:hypothetical protein
VCLLFRVLRSCDDVSPREMERCSRIPLSAPPYLLPGDPVGGRHPRWEGGVRGCLRGVPPHPHLLPDLLRFELLEARWGGRGEWRIERGNVQVVRCEDGGSVWYLVKASRSRLSRCRGSRRRISLRSLIESWMWQWRKVAAIWWTSLRSVRNELCSLLDHIPSYLIVL